MSNNVCQQIQNMQADLKNLLSQNSDGSINNNDMVNFYAKYNIAHTGSVIQAQQNKCINLASSVSKQVINIKNECITTIKNMCSRTAKNENEYDKCYNMFSPALTNITQTNISNIAMNCNIQSLAKTTEAKENKKLALVLQMQLAKYELNCSTITDVNLIQNTEKFINELNQCINIASVSQSSILEGCYINDVVQTNLSKIIQECIIKSESSDTVASSNTDNNIPLTTPSNLKSTTPVSSSTTPVPSSTTSSFDIKDILNNQPLLIGIILIIMFFSSSSSYMITKE